MLKARVVRVGVNEKTNTPVLILIVDEVSGILPISIGKREAKAIVLALQKVELSRPISYDLMKSILDELEISLEQIRITALKSGTYYAELDLTSGEQKLIIDSRPSDAIALALRMNAPIYIEESVVKEAVVPHNCIEMDERPQEESVDFDREREDFRRFLETVRPEDFGSPEELE